jgi:hypothetical protein
MNPPLTCLAGTIQRVVRLAIVLARRGGWHAARAGVGVNCRTLPAASPTATKDSEFACAIPTMQMEW